jgi:hypothetical protein
MKVTIGNVAGVLIVASTIMALTARGAVEGLLRHERIAVVQPFINWEEPYIVAFPDLIENVEIPAAGQVEFVLEVCGFEIDSVSIAASADTTFSLAFDTSENHVELSGSNVEATLSDPPDRLLIRNRSSTRPMEVRLVLNRYVELQP